MVHINCGVSAEFRFDYGSFESLVVLLVGPRMCAAVLEMLNDVVGLSGLEKVPLSVDQWCRLLLTFNLLSLMARTKASM